MYYGASAATNNGAGITINNTSAGEASIQMGTSSSGPQYHIVANAGSPGQLSFYKGLYGSGTLLASLDSGGNWSTTGDMSINVNPGERHFKYTGTNTNWGIYGTTNGMGLYDWQNGRMIIDYGASGASLKLMENGGSVGTKNNTLDNGSGAATFTGQITASGGITTPGTINFTGSNGTNKIVYPNAWAGADFTTGTSSRHINMVTLADTTSSRLLWDIEETTNWAHQLEIYTNGTLKLLNSSAVLQTPYTVLDAQTTGSANTGSGRISKFDRATGSVVVQLGNNGGSGQTFDIIDSAWSKQLFHVTNTNVVSTYNNTLDDGGGNLSTQGTVTVGSAQTSPLVLTGAGQYPTIVAKNGSTVKSQFIWDTVGGHVYSDVTGNFTVRNQVNGGTFILQVTNAGAVTTKNNTLDDNAGNAIFSGKVSTNNNSPLEWRSATGTWFWGRNVDGTTFRFSSGASEGSVVQLSLNSSGAMYSKNNTLDDGSGNLTAIGVLEGKGFDFRLGAGDQSSRGNTGTSRALVKNSGSKLYINYSGDFSGGTWNDQGIQGGTRGYVKAVDAQPSPSSTTSIATTGWYNLAHNPNADRAYGKFTLLDFSPARHQVLQFTCANAFSSGVVSTMRVLGQVRAAGTPFRYLRVVYNGSASGDYWLQAYIDISDNTSNPALCRVLLEDNYWDSGWQLLNFTAATVPSGYSTQQWYIADVDHAPNIYTNTGSPPSQGAGVGDIYIQY